MNGELVRWISVKNDALKCILSNLWGNSTIKVYLSGLRTNRPVCGKTLEWRRFFLYTKFAKIGKQTLSFCIPFQTGKNRRTAVQRSFFLPAGCLPGQTVAGCLGWLWAGEAPRLSMMVMTSPRMLFSVVR